MRRHPSRTSVCNRHFAGRKSLTLRRLLGAKRLALGQMLSRGQRLPYKSTGLLGRCAVDALVFEFMGLAMLALCVIVLVVPSTRQPSGRHASERHLSGGKP